MTAPELRAALDRLSLSQAAAARLTGYDKQSLHRYHKGDLAVPRPLAACVGLLLRLHEARMVLEPSEAR